MGGYGAGITVGVLHTGSKYADDLTEDGVIYHYPVTSRGSRDDSEIQATKACGDCGLPVFVIVTPTAGSPVRNVKLGWVTDYNDSPGRVLITFSEAQVALNHTEPTQTDVAEFVLQAARKRGQSRTQTRPNQSRFRYDVLTRYGTKCAVCDISQSRLLEAAHICPVENNGTDDPRNGLVLCLTHHRAFDLGLFRIHPDTLEIHLSPEIGNAELLGLRLSSVAHLPSLPHRSALEWAWRRTNAS